MPPLGRVRISDCDSPATAKSGMLRYCCVMRPTRRPPRKFVSCQGEGRMKKVLGLIGATLLFAGPALAADLAVKAPALAGPLPSQWSGFYLGIHGGYCWGPDSTGAPLSPLPPPPRPPPPGGAVFGPTGV